MLLPTEHPVLGLKEAHKQRCPLVSLPWLLVTGAPQLWVVSFALHRPKVPQISLPPRICRGILSSLLLLPRTGYPDQSDPGVSKPHPSQSPSPLPNLAKGLCREIEASEQVAALAPHPPGFLGEGPALLTVLGSSLPPVHLLRDGRGCSE